ncbi:MAG: GAF domain-containing protein [Chthoniobacteraceae bacterium]
MQAPIPDHENERLQSLYEYKILDTKPEAGFDDLTRLAAFICDTPISTVTLVDTDRQWFKSKVGFTHDSDPREQSICAHAIVGEELFIVPDTTLDDRFAGLNAVVGGPKIRFYAGAPLRARDGFILGTLCVIDNKARTLSEEQKDALRALSRQVMAQLELRRNLEELRMALAARDVIEESKTQVIHELERALEQVNTLTGLLPICAWCKKIRDDSGYWGEVETYIADHSTATFSHGVCPDCVKLHLRNEQ